MSELTTLTIDGLTLTRVLYADVMIAPEAAGLTAHDLMKVPWRAPLWADDTQLGASASAWVIETLAPEGIANTAPRRRIVLEPLQAADDVLHDPDAGTFHADAFAEVMARTGYPVESIDTVVISHLETIGMVARREPDGSWQRFFPNARILIPRVSYELFCAMPPDFPSTVPWQRFIEQGWVDTFDDGDEIVSGMRVELTGAHNPGHCVFHFGTGPIATWLGHLAINPLHLATGLCPLQHPEPERAWELLQGFRNDGRLLLGPLWPSPAIGRWDTDHFVAGNA